MKPFVIDKHATSLIAAVQRGLEVGAAFRASSAGAAFPGPFDSASAGASGASAGEDVDAAALYQPALHRYFESTLPGALKPAVVPVAATAAPVSSPHIPVALAGLQRLWTETKSQKLSIPVALLCVDEQPDAADSNAAAVPSNTTADEDATGASYRSKSWQRNVIGNDLDKIKSGAAALVRSRCFIFLRACWCQSSKHTYRTLPYSSSDSPRRSGTLLPAAWSS